MKLSRFAVILCGLLTISGQQASAVWQTMYPYGAIPFTATPIPSSFYFFSTPVSSITFYTCRVAFRGGEHPGWTKAGEGACHFGWGGSEQTSIGTYDIWVEDWEPGAYGQVPAGAVIFGAELAGPRYPCLVQHFDYSLQLGKVAPDIGGCDYPWGGLEYHATSYSVLVDSALNMIDNPGGSKQHTVDPNPGGSQPYALVGPYMAQWAPFAGDIVNNSYGPPVGGGFDSDLSPLFLCSVPYGDGYQIGKIKASTICDISYGGREFYPEPEYAYYLTPNWVGPFSGGTVPINQLAQLPQNQTPGPSFESAIIGGNESDGTHLYICAAYIASAQQVMPGRTRANLGGCSIGYQGIEMVVSPYAVLVETYNTP